MKACDVQLSGAIDLYFYDELPPDERRDVEDHLRRCSACREALADLTVIRSGLAARPDIVAPDGRDWTRLMARIEAAVAAEPAPAGSPPLAAPGGRRIAPARGWPPGRRMLPARFAVAGLGLAAAVTFITATTARIVRQQGTAPGVVASHAPASQSPAVVPARFDAANVPGDGTDPGLAAGLAAVSEQHFERSRLVVLGLTARDPRRASARDWEYERRMAGSLLEDTRLYKQAAADRGMTSLAGVMSDLELVLLQTSLADRQDPATLARLQRLIRKRDLVTRMDVAALGQ